MLRVRDLDVSIQASRILHGVSLEVDARELVCLVGRNGAGKTTTFRTIMGYLTPEAGRGEFKDRPLAGLPSHATAALGVGPAPEDGAIFAGLSVAENIEIA